MQGQNWSYAVKYFRIYIDKQLKVARRANYVVNRAKAAKAMMYQVINARSPLSINTKLQIYKQYILPILTYGAAAWAADIFDSRWKTLQSMQAKILRMVTRAEAFVNN